MRKEFVVITCLIGITLWILIGFINIPIPLIETSFSGRKNIWFLLFGSISAYFLGYYTNKKYN